MRIIRYNFANHEIITGDQDGKISVWSLKGGEPLRNICLISDVFEAHKGAITQLLWDEDTKILISVGKDRALRVINE
jgi:WD40 repeat protein